MSDLLGIVCALTEAGCLQEPLFDAALDAASRCAATLDVPGASCLTLPDMKVPTASDVPFVLRTSPNLCVLWKPPGWTVLADRVTEDERGEQEQEREQEQESIGLFESDGLFRPFEDWVIQHLGPHSAIACDADASSGLLHRLDRETSGALLAARTYQGYHEAQLLFAARRVRKEYVCLCHGRLEPGPRLIDVPLRRKDRYRSIAVHSSGGGN